MAWHFKKVIEEFVIYMLINDTFSNLELISRSMFRAIDDYLIFFQRRAVLL